jgi:hypothetical protein
MTSQSDLQATYNNRHIEYSLKSAADYLIDAAVAAGRAHAGLHWLSGAHTALQHARERIAEFEAFVAAVEAGSAQEASALLASHNEHVSRLCADFAA